MTITLNTIREKTGIDLKSLVFGAAIFTVLAVIGFQNQDSILFNLLFPISAIGLIYTGYNAKNLIWGIILGAIATLPLIFISVYWKILPITSSDELLITVIALLITGAIIGFVGAYVKRSRDMYRAQKASIGKNKNKKKNKKN